MQGWIQDLDLEAAAIRVLKAQEWKQWRIQRGDEGDASPHRPRRIGSLFHVVSECHTVLALLQNRDGRREPFIH